MLAEGPFMSRTVIGACPGPDSNLSTFRLLSKSSKVCNGPAILTRAIDKWLCNP